MLNKDKIQKIEQGLKEKFIEKSNHHQVDEDLQKTIKNDIDSIFQFDKNYFEISEHDAFKQFPLVTKDNYDEMIQYYGSNPLFKNRFKLAKEGKAFKLDELNGIVKAHRDEVIINAYFKFMDAKRQQSLDELYAKIELVANMTKNVKVISDVFGRFFDLSLHDLYDMDMSFIHKMKELFASRSFVQKIAELLGRAASAFKEYEDYLVTEMKFIPSRKKYSYAPENLIGVTQGNHIPDLLPFSLAYRNHEKTNKIFKVQYIEKKLAQFDKRAKVTDEIKVSRTERRLKEDSQGPFILVIDTSGSMHGEPEIMAKALALAFINIANKEDRKCYIINFSNGTVEFDASNLGTSWKHLYEFLAKSFGGGTDIGPAIIKAIDKAETEGYKNSDIIFISDLIINSIQENVLSRINQLKKNKVRFHSLTIGNSYNKIASGFLDNNWMYDGSKESIDNILRDLEKYTQNN